MLVIYCLDVNNKLSKVKLPKEVVLHINKFKNKTYKKISKLAWSHLINLLCSKHKVNIKSDKVCFTTNGKPYLKSNKLFFSISHSLNLIALAISDKNVGIDIEKLMPFDICEPIAQRILNKKEYSTYLKSKNKSAYLTNVWTKKEALVKLNDLSILDTKSLVSLNVNKCISCNIKDSNSNEYVLSYIII